MDIATLGIGIDSRPVDTARASLGEFTQAAGRAEQAAAGVGDGAKKGADGVKDLEDSMTRASVKGLLAADSIQKGVELAIDAIKQLYALMMEVGDYQDLADMTGASAINIAKMQTAADVAGVSMEGLAGYMNQMTRVMSNTDEESDKAAVALSRIGLSFKELQMLDPAERMVKVAQAMGTLADGTHKTEVAQALFGRGAGNVIKVMKELADEKAFQTKLNEDLIITTDDYADSNNRLFSQIRQTIQYQAASALPGWVALRDVLIDLVSETKNLENATGESADKMTYFQSVVQGLAETSVFVIGFFQALYRVVEGVLDAMLTLVKATGEVITLDWAAATKTLEDSWTRMKARVTDNTAFGAYYEKLQQQEIDAAQRKGDAMLDEARRLGAAVTEIERKASEKRKKEAEKAAKEAAKTAKWLVDEKAKIDMEEFDKERARDLKEFEDKYSRDVAGMRKQEQEQQKADDKRIDSEIKEIEKINEKAEALEIEVAQHGKLKHVLEEEKLVIMERDLAEFEGDAISRKNLENKIAAQRRYIAAMKSKEVTDAAADAAKKAQGEFEKAWEQVGQSLADQLMKGSLNAAQLIKNLFKTMILQPTIMGAMAGAGQSFMAGAAGGATGTGGQQTGLAGLGQMAGSAAGTALFGGVGTAATAGYTAAAAGGAGVIGSAGAGAYAGLMAIPVAGWVALAAIAAYALYKKFGKGGGAKIEGSAGLGGSSLIGGMGNELDPQATKAVTDLNAQYRRMATMLGASTRSMEFGVGLSTDPRGDAPSMVQVRSEISQYVNKNVGRSQEELAKAMAEGAATVMVEALRNSGMDTQMLAYFDKITVGATDEQKLAAFEQVAAIGEFWRQLKGMGGVVTQLGSISLEAAVNLAELSGGIGNLASGLASYQKNFFSAKEQENLAYQQMAATLNEAGSGYYGFSEAILRSYSKERFREIVEGLNLENEGDRMRYVSLMKVAGTFAELYDATHKVIDAEQALADAREAAANKYEEALDNLRDAYERQKDVLTTTRDAMKSATESFLDFNKSLRVDQTLSTLTPQERMKELETQYSEARFKTVAGGYQAEDISRMQETARALLQGGREFYGSGQGYDELFKKITQEMEIAAGSTKYKQDVADLQLRQLETQVGYLVNIDKTLLSVNEALWQLNSARSEVYALGYPHAEGLSRVPFNNYPALLHTDEMVLPQNESAFIRGLPDFSGELRALRQEVVALRKENRQDAGNTIGATYTAAQQSAQVQSEATIRAARQRLYQSRSRPVLA